MYHTHTGPIGCIMLALWPHKYKVGHIDLIPIKHQNLLNSTETPEFSYVTRLTLRIYWNPLLPTQWEWIQSLITWYQLKRQCHVLYSIFILQ